MRLKSWNTLLNLNSGVSSLAWGEEKKKNQKKNPLPALFQLQLGYPGNVNWVLLLTFMTLSHRKQGRKYHKSLKLTSVQQWERRADGNHNLSKHPTVAL